MIGFEQPVSALRVLNGHNVLYMSGGIQEFRVEAGTPAPVVNVVSAASMAHASHALNMSNASAIHDGDRQTCFHIPYRTFNYDNVWVALDLGEEVNATSIILDSGDQDLDAFVVYFGNTLEEVTPSGQRYGEWNANASLVDNMCWHYGSMRYGNHGESYTSGSQYHASPSQVRVPCRRRGRFVSVRMRDGYNDNLTLCELRVLAAAEDTWQPLLSTTLEPTFTYADDIRPGTNPDDRAGTPTWSVLTLPTTTTRYLRLTATSLYKRMVHLARVEVS